ncbi:hypothetical protein GGF32_005050 [Allomyces javanicus]|nr:hypothetical protein GGF32_005050 [Allomyces javanicus]
MTMTAAAAVSSSTGHHHHHHHHTATGLTVSGVLDEYLETLSAEVTVDVAKLRDLARHGIPAPVRGDVWCYLLGIAPADRSHELSRKRARAAAYEALCASTPTHHPVLKQVRGEVNRFLRRTPLFNRLVTPVVIPLAETLPGPLLSPANGGTSPGSESSGASDRFNLAGSSPPVGAGSGAARRSVFVDQCPLDGATVHTAPPLYSGVDAVRAVFERVITAYLNSATQADYHPSWVALLAPFVYCIRDERDIYYCFEALMQQLETLDYEQPLPRRVSQFMALFRTTLPDLYTYFDDESADAKDWLAPMFQSLLARELPFESVLRLWDAYFAERHGIALHPYLCLALLHALKDNLEDLECSEILGVLRRLPFKPVDIENLVYLAKNLRMDAERDSGAGLEFAHGASLDLDALGMGGADDWVPSLQAAAGSYDQARGFALAMSR